MAAIFGDKISFILSVTNVFKIFFSGRSIESDLMCDNITPRTVFVQRVSRHLRSFYLLEPFGDLVESRG